MLMKKSHHGQKGVSLVELMVGLAIGLIIVGAASTVYVNAVRSGSDTLRSAKLNIELRGAMDMMVAEIRRAGYFNMATPSTNPFTQATTNLSSPSTDCILFSYDANGNGTTDSSDFFGFRRVDSAISMRFGGNPTPTTSAGCAVSTDSWEGITDPNSVIVDTLTFAIAYQCINAQTGLSSAIQPCSAGNSVYTAATTGVTSKSDLVEVRDVTISLVGHHKNDTLTTMSLSQSVRVRNDRIQTVP